MIRIEERIPVTAPPQALYAWFEQLDRNFGDWHPAHHDCRYLCGEGFAPGCELELELDLHGVRHTHRLTLTGVTPGSRIDFRIGRKAHGTIRFVPLGRGSEFIVELRLGSWLPLIGPVIDWLIRRMLRHCLDAIRRLILEDGVRLRELALDPDFSPTLSPTSL